MKFVFDTFNRWSLIVAALVLGAAGIFDVIDQTTMIILLVVLIATQSRACLSARKA